MFDSRTVTDIDARRRMLRSRIAARRTETARGIVPIVKVLIWADVARLCWRRLPVLAKIAGASGASVAGWAALRGGGAGFRRWLPVALVALRFLRAGSNVQTTRRRASAASFPEKSEQP